MNKLSFIQLIRNPKDMTTSDEVEIDRMIVEYPWFAMAHMLKLKGLKIKKSAEFNSQLPITTLYAYDRRLLFKFIHENEVDDRLAGVIQPPYIDEELPTPLTQIELDNTLDEKELAEENQTSPLKEEINVQGESPTTNIESDNDVIFEGTLTNDLTSEGEESEGEENAKIINDNIVTEEAKEETAALNDLRVQEASTLDLHTDTLEPLNKLEKPFTQPDDQENSNDELEHKESEQTESNSFEINAALAESIAPEANKEIASEVNNVISNEQGLSVGFEEEEEHSEEANAGEFGETIQPNLTETTTAIEDTLKKTTVDTRIEASEFEQTNLEMSEEKTNEKLDQNERHDFFSWLNKLHPSTKIDSFEGMRIEEAPPISVYNPIVIESMVHAEEDPDALIEKFIQDSPSVSRKKETNFSAEEKVKASSELKDDLLTETLVKIMVSQGKFEKAIESYQKLQLRYPNKKAYFAALIEKLEEKIKS